MQTCWSSDKGFISYYDHTLPVVESAAHVHLKQTQSKQIIDAQFMSDIQVRAIMFSLNFAPFTKKES